MRGRGDGLPSPRAAQGELSRAQADAKAAASQLTAERRKVEKLALNVEHLQEANRAAQAHILSQPLTGAGAGAGASAYSAMVAHAAAAGKSASFVGASPLAAMAAAGVAPSSLGGGGAES